MGKNGTMGFNMLERFKSMQALCNKFINEIKVN